MIAVFIAATYGLIRYHTTLSRLTSKIELTNAWWWWYDRKYKKAPLLANHIVIVEMALSRTE